MHRKVGKNRCQLHSEGELERQECRLPGAGIHDLTHETAKPRQETEVHTVFMYPNKGQKKELEFSSPHKAPNDRVAVPSRPSVPYVSSPRPPLADSCGIDHHVPKGEGHLCKETEGRSTQGPGPAHSECRSSVLPPEDSVKRHPTVWAKTPSAQRPQQGLILCLTVRKEQKSCGA